MVDSLPPTFLDLGVENYYPSPSGHHLKVPTSSLRGLHIREYLLQHDGSSTPPVRLNPDRSRNTSQPLGRNAEITVRPYAAGGGFPCRVCVVRSG